MNFDDAIQLVEAALEENTGRKLTAPEKEILKAAWENEPYSTLADSLYLSVGHIKDLASLLWQRISDVLEEKVTKTNFRYILEEKGITPKKSLGKILTLNLDIRDNIGNILIVDDLIENLRFLTDILTKRGYKVRSVTNGKMALKTINKNPPDLVLLDIKMPEMDGYEVCATLKADENFREIPIIFLSALDQVIDKVKAFELGGVDYITKPFNAEETIARIQTQLTIQQQKLQLRQQLERHQQTAEILYQSRSLLASLLNSSLDGIAALQAVRNSTTGQINDFRCLVVNPVMAKLLGKTREELTGYFTIKPIINQISPNLFDACVAVVETGISWRQEFYFETSISKKWYSLNITQFGDGLSITTRDITDLKNLQAQLKQIPGTN